MDIIHTETNRGKKSIIYDGYSYRKVNSLKNGNVVYRCSTGKSCKATTDEKGVAVMKMKNEHNHESDEKKVEVKQLRVRIRKHSGT